MHPLRVRQYAVSDLNPFLASLPFAAALAREHRRPVREDNICLQYEHRASKMLGSALDFFRDARDCCVEQAVKFAYGSTGLASYAVRAIDLALWDARGKVLEQPVYKLLGGPQAGLLLGQEETVMRLARHPLARAVRADKLTLAALEATRPRARSFASIRTHRRPRSAFSFETLLVCSVSFNSLLAPIRSRRASIGHPAASMKSGGADGI